MYLHNIDIWTTLILRQLRTLGNIFFSGEDIIIATSSSTTNTGLTSKYCMIPGESPMVYTG